MDDVIKQAKMTVMMREIGDDINTLDEQFLSRTYQIFFNGQRPADRMITAFAFVTIILCTSTRNFTNAFLIQRRLSSSTNVGTSTHCAGQRFIVARRLKETSVDTPPVSAVADVETAEEDLQEGLRVKLKEEISSPFRKVRQFIYSGAGIAGLIGTVTAVPQLLFAVQDGGEAIAGAITNVAIDLGAVVLAVVLWDKDAEGERIKLERFTRKEKLLSYQMSSTDITDREKDISLLPVEIQVSEKDENATRIVSLGELQSKGKQNIIIVAGKRDFVKDVVISAKIEGADLFNSKEIYVVPVVLEDDQLDAALAKGFGAPKESLMSAPYIGKPMQMNVWEAYLKKETDLAVLQGESDIVKKGIVIAVKRSGKVLKRGVGIPPWKLLAEDLQEKRTSQ